MEETECIEPFVDILDQFYNPTLFVSTLLSMEVKWGEIMIDLNLS